MIDSLRKFLEQAPAQKVKHKHTWLDLLPLAIWSANDLPGPISGYSPHRLLFGRDPVGFGEHPPLVADHGSEDALHFFRRVESERNYVRTKLTQIHAKLTAAFNKAHPTRVFQPGERVWVRVNRQPGSGSKLDRLWIGPAAILQQISDVERVAGPYGEQELEVKRLKPYLPPLKHGAPPLHSYADKETLVDSEKLIIEKI